MGFSFSVFIRFTCASCASGCRHHIGSSLRADCLPSHSRSSLRAGTMVLYLLIPSLRPPGQGPTHSKASLGSASNPEMRSWSWDAISISSGRLQNKEKRTMHLPPMDSPPTWNCPPTSHLKPCSSAQVWPPAGTHAHPPGWATWGPGVKGR